MHPSMTPRASFHGSRCLVGDSESCHCCLQTGASYLGTGKMEHLCPSHLGGHHQALAHPGAPRGCSPPRSVGVHGATLAAWANECSRTLLEVLQWTPNLPTNEVSLCQLVKSCLLLSARSRTLQVEAGDKITVYQVKPLNRISLYIVTLISSSSLCPGLLSGLKWLSPLRQMKGELLPSLDT